MQAPGWLINLFEAASQLPLLLVSNNSRMPRELRNVVFVDGVRTPFGKAGSIYAETRADDLVVHCIRELLRRHPELPPERIDDVAIAATTQTGDQGLTIGRTAALLAGIPRSVPGFAIDRMCAGALTAVTTTASGIAFGAYDVALAGGVEHMGHHPWARTSTQTPECRREARRPVSVDHGSNGGEPRSRRYHQGTSGCLRGA